MFLILWKLVYSVLLTFGVILTLLAMIYYFLLLMSVMFGLFGWYRASNWFRIKVDCLSLRITKVMNIILRRK